MKGIDSNSTRYNNQIAYLGPYFSLNIFVIPVASVLKMCNETAVK